MTDQPQAITPSKASHPFDDPSADIILRTSDLIDFYVHRPILSYASPIFSSMLSLPQSENDSRAQPPIIDVSENSQALDNLLRLCYPILKPQLSELADIVPALKAALKYEMEWPVFLLSKDLLATIPSSPLKVWAAACRAGLEDVAREAAFEIRRRDRQPRAQSVLVELLAEDALRDDLHDVLAGDYFRLREFLRLPEPPSASFRFLSPSLTSLLEQYSGRDRPPQRSVVHPPGGFYPRISSTDVILQCRDWEGVQHRAHGVVLTLHSAVLGEQFTRAKADWAANSHANDVDSDGTAPGGVELPVLHLDVASDTLVSLLNVCYDGPGSLPSSLASLTSMLTASRDLHMSQIHSLVVAQWEAVAEKSPLEAYFVAIQYGLRDQARAAARKAVEKPLAGWYDAHMERSSALAYHHLLHYYDACVQAVQEQLEKGISDWKCLTQNFGSRPHYNGCVIISQMSNTGMETYLRGVKDRAGNQGPGRGWEVTTRDLLKRTSNKQESFWPVCVSSQCQVLANGIVQLGTSLPKAIADAIAQVEIEFYELDA